MFAIGGHDNNENQYLTSCEKWISSSNIHLDKHIIPDSLCPLVPGKMAPSSVLLGAHLVLPPTKEWSMRWEGWALRRTWKAWRDCARWQTSGRWCRTASSLSQGGFLQQLFTSQSDSWRANKIVIFTGTTNDSKWKWLTWIILLDLAPLQLQRSNELRKNELFICMNYKTFAYVTLTI